MATTKFKMLAVVVLIGGGLYSARAEEPQEKSAKSAAHAQDKSVPPAQLKAAQDEPGPKPTRRLSMPSSFLSRRNVEDLLISWSSPNNAMLLAMRSSLPTAMGPRRIT